MVNKRRARTVWRNSVEDRPMYLRPRNTTKFAHSRLVIECAQCGKQLFVPERSEFIDDRRVRHLWECEACGYAFKTTVRFAVAA